MEGAAYARRKRAHKGLFRCINRPPGFRSTVKGFFPSVRWVFYAELISEALKRHKRLLESQIWRWLMDVRPGADEAEKETFA